MTDLYKIKPLSFELAPSCERETWSAGSYVIKRYDAPEQWFVTFYGRRIDECGSLEMAFEAARKHHLERITRYLEPVPEVVAQWRTDMENAPRDGSSFVAGGWVENIYGEAWWEEHVIWLDDETGEILAECECPLAIEDFEHWTPLPPPPALATVEKA